MLKSLYSGISGLKTHQTKMDVVGNNIANVNTYGFKASRASFKDVFYQTMTNSADPTDTLGGRNASQVGFGSTIASIDVLHTRAGYAATGRGMDVAIEGEGFLIAQDASGETMYTRVGQLYFDADGYLVDSNRNYVCGYPIKGNGNNIEFEKNTPAPGTGGKGNVKVDTGTNNGDKFNDWNFKFVQDDTATDGSGAAAGGVDNAKVAVSGKTITITASSAVVAQATWDKMKAMTVAPTIATPGSPTDQESFDTALWTAKQNLPKGSDPTLITFPGLADAFVAGSGSSTVLTVTGGVSAETGKPVIDVANGAQRIKKPNTLVDSDGNGYYDTTGAGIADLKSIAIGTDGTITGTTSEDKVIAIGQICLATIPNQEALVMQGNSYYKAINNTGDIKVEAAGAGTGGKLVPSNLESSNVDLSNEFADMITTQRGFQANSRIITVGDQMLEELVNMKR